MSNIADKNNFEERLKQLTNIETEIKNTSVTSSKKTRSISIEQNPENIPEPYFEIKGRDITVPSVLKDIGVERDVNSETVTFHMNRFVDGEDISKHSCYIKFLTPDGKGDRYPVFDIRVETNDIYFDWTIDSKVTRLSGQIKFAVSFETMKDNKLIYNWQTVPTSFNILSGLKVDELISDQYPTLLQQWLNQFEIKARSIVGNAPENMNTLEKMSVIVENKVNTEIGKGLSSNDFTDIEKNKLSNLENYDDANVKEMILQTSINSQEYTDAVVGTKVDKEDGKSLSTNDFTTAEKEKLSILKNYDDTEIKSALSQSASDTKIYVDTELLTKVDLEVGKGLSTNDFTTDEKDKLAGIDDNHFKGTFTTKDALDTAHPSSMAGDYAYVGVAGTDEVICIWDNTDLKWVVSGGTSTETPAIIKSKYESNANTNAYTDADKNSVATISNKLDKTGGAVTGSIALSTAPTEDNHIVNKKYVDDLVSDRGIFTLMHIKSNTIHKLSGVIPTTGITTIRFKASASFSKGNNFTINDVVYTAKTSNGEAYEAEFAVGAIITMEVDIDAKVLTVQSGAGGSGGDATQEMAIVTLSTDDNQSVSGQIVTYKNITKGTTQNFTYGAQPIVIPVDLGDKYELSVSGKTLYQSPPSFVGLTATYAAARGFSFRYKAAVRYGIRIKKSEPDPYLRVEYLYDAVGFTPAKMNYATGEFNYGSWHNFLINLYRPCMVNYDLTIRGELRRDDLTKYIDNTESGISDFSTPANAMSVFEKWYQYIYEDATYEYYVISNIKWDNNYTCNHCYNELGEQDYMMLPMFGASFDGTRLRSIAGKPLDGSKTRTVETAQAKANGSGWNTMTYSKLLFRNIVLELISKCTNSQLAFGQGNSTSGVYLNTGALIDKGDFYGYSETTKQVKVLGCEMPWGDKFQHLAGLVSTGSNSYLYTKLIPPYNEAGSGYTQVTTTTNGYVKEHKVSNLVGAVPNVVGGSDTTYFSDYLYMAANCYALFGGLSSRGGVCGARFLSVDAAPSYTGVNFVGSLSA